MTYRQLAQRVRVPSGFVLLPLLFIMARPTLMSLVIGAFFSVTGLAIRAWASGFLRKNEKLITSGPYGHTRNPLYFGTLLLGLGTAIAGGNVWFVLLFIIFFLAVYVPVILAEADTMLQMFPESYKQYRRAVPLFLPRLHEFRLKASRDDFDSSLYIKHREYRAAIGTVIVWLLLVIEWRVFLN